VYYYRDGIGCEKDAKRAKVNFLVAAELGDVNAMEALGELLNENDPQRFVWFGRAAATAGLFLSSVYFLDGMCNQIQNFKNGTGHAEVVFTIGRALKGQVDKEKGTIFGIDYFFETYTVAANRALHFYEFQLQSYRKAVDSWTVVGLRNRVVKDNER
jgi:hypothetical protein